MSNELKKRIAALRGISPRLNSVTDQVSEIVKSVEKTLVEELNVGIEASVKFLSEPVGQTGVSREHFLAFNRVGSAGYRLHVAIRTIGDSTPEPGVSGTSTILNEEQVVQILKGAAVDTVSGTSATLNEEQVLWPSCSREMKLRAFDKLPELLDQIIKNAEGLLKTAELTAARIKEMVGESDVFARPTEASGKSARSGRRRRREYSVQDARRAHRQYFLDQGLSEAAISTLCLDGWQDDGPDRFVNRDGWGKLRCSVAFEDEDGNAEISFPDAETESVAIEDED
jgi:hypothetical protein